MIAPGRSQALMPKPFRGKGTRVSPMGHIPALVAKRLGAKELP